MDFAIHHFIFLLLIDISTLTSNHTLLQVEGSRAEPSPSSSRMIDFEFSNGHPVGPLPTSVDDDEYVEYPLDNVAGVPCNVEEEERVSHLLLSSRYDKVAFD